jgi:hypothetical protein
VQNPYHLRDIDHLSQICLLDIFGSVTEISARIVKKLNRNKSNDSIILAAAEGEGHFQGTVSQLCRPEGRIVTLKGHAEAKKKETSYCN